MVLPKIQSTHKTLAHSHQSHEVPKEDVIKASAESRFFQPHPHSPLKKLWQKATLLIPWEAQSQAPQAFPVSHSYPPNIFLFFLHTHWSLLLKADPPSPDVFSPDPPFVSPLPPAAAVIRLSAAPLPHVLSRLWLDPALPMFTPFLTSFYCHHISAGVDNISASTSTPTTPSRKSGLLGQHFCPHWFDSVNALKILSSLAVPSVTFPRPWSPLVLSLGDSLCPHVL